MLFLSRSDVLSLLTLPDCIEAVEAAFRCHAERRTFGPGVLGVPTSGGGFHVKAAGLSDDRGVFAAKSLVDSLYPRAEALAQRVAARHGLDAKAPTDLRGSLVVDVLDQCAEIGELQHALAAGLMTREDVHAEMSLDA
jgi:ornithine cyclodeaminase/alanine dehydrogenase-like protein (mu-crystallin family)